MNTTRALAIVSMLLLCAECACSQAPSDPIPANSVQAPGGWKSYAIELAYRVMGAEEGVVFWAQDQLVYPGQDAKLSVRFQKARDFKGIEGIEAEFSDGKKVIGTAKSDKDGYATIQWKAPAKGEIPLTVKIKSIPSDMEKDVMTISPRNLLVVVRSRETELAVLDLDHTVVASDFWKVLFGNAVPMVDSVRVTKMLAEKYTIVYLTQRPDLLSAKSKQWLIDNGFPTGVMLVGTLNDVIGGSGPYKKARLASLKQNYPNIKLGIGDKSSDASAYIDNGVTAYLIPNYNPNKLKDVTKLADEIRALPDNGLLNVVGSWKEIEQSITQSRKYPPKAFIAALESRAQELNRGKKPKAPENDDD